MYDEQTRINATISYLFLGPIFLLARKGTPLAEKYVQDHAKRASLLILGSLGAYIVYHFLEDFLSVSIIGISLATVILAILVTAILALLLHGAYFAFSGYEAEKLKLGNILMKGGLGSREGIGMFDETKTDVSTYSDEEKIRIVASFFPFIGIFLASRYNNNEIQIGRKVGSFMTATIIISSFIFSSSGIAVLLSILYIGLIVITLVGLFVQKQFFSLGFYEYIPVYTEFEAHVFASIRYALSFIKVIFGGGKKMDYREVYDEILARNTETIRRDSEINTEGQTSYFMPLWIIGLPVINLITLPSLFNNTYARYRDIILQGIFLTLLFMLIGSTYGWNSSLETILLFPMIHLMSFSGRDATTRAPIVSLGISIVRLISASKTTINETVAKKEEKVSFSYEAKQEEVEEKIASL